MDVNTRLNPRTVSLDTNNIHSLPLECNVCHKRFARKRLLDDHQYRHTGNKPFKCEHCPKSFPTEHLLRNHTMNIHKPKTIPCDVRGCEKKFTTLKNLNNHMKTHQDKSGIEKKFHCQWPDCHKKFQYRANLNRHMNRHNKIYSFHCDWPECGKGFVTKFELNNHINSHSNYRPYVCQWPGCDHAFTSSNSLSVHSGRHKGYTHICRFKDCRFKCFDSYRLKIHQNKEHSSI